MPDDEERRDEPDPPAVPRAPYRDQEAALGGADAVPDTSYVPRRESERRKDADAPVTARVPAGSGQGATWAILAFLFIGAVLVYLLGFGQ